MLVLLSIKNSILVEQLSQNLLCIGRFPSGHIFVYHCDHAEQCTTFLHSDSRASISQIYLESYRDLLE